MKASPISSGHRRINLATAKVTTGIDIAAGAKREVSAEPGTLSLPTSIPVRDETDGLTTWCDLAACTVEQIEA
jgi:hypothetical protein